ncbi:MAG: hypothetical protein Q7U28_15685 [Aquabacterium sp.]|nr:hypothetical protein [Aquabacterium sp.]
MTISPFFLELRSAYQSEMDDLTFDSEGRDVLRQRLVEKRQELGFLLKMMELSPEMVAVIFHQGFRFKRPAVLDHMLSLESDEFPDWDTLSDALTLTPWAQDLAMVILTQPMGEWFMAVAAGLEYMYSKPNPSKSTLSDDEDGDEDDGDDADRDEADSEEDAEDRAREEAGADWMVEQGFDRKDR